MPIYETILLDNLAFGDTRTSRKAILCLLSLIGSSFGMPNKDRASISGKSDIDFAKQCVSSGNGMVAVVKAKPNLKDIFFAVSIHKNLNTKN